MALFKILKGSSDKLLDAARSGKAGYCYYTTDEHKFYVLLEDGGTPIPLNALQAELDSEGNNIAEQFGGIDSHFESVKNSIGDLTSKFNAHAHNDLYYTKTQIDEFELITTADIDAICGASIAVATANEGVF